MNIETPFSQILAGLNVGRTDFDARFEAIWQEVTSTSDEELDAMLVELEAERDLHLVRSEAAPEASTGTDPCIGDVAVLRLIREVRRRVGTWWKHASRPTSGFAFAGVALALFVTSTFAATVLTRREREPDGLMGERGFGRMDVAGVRPTLPPTLMLTTAAGPRRLVAPVAIARASFENPSPRQGTVEQVADIKRTRATYAKNLAQTALFSAVLNALADCGTSNEARCGDGAGAVRADGDGRLRAKLELALRTLPDDFSGPAAAICGSQPNGDRDLECFRVSLKDSGNVRPLLALLPVSFEQRAGDLSGRPNVMVAYASVGSSVRHDGTTFGSR